MFDKIQDMFSNSVGFNTAEIIIATNNRDISIYYHLNDNPVQHIWQDIHKDSVNFSMGITNGQDVGTLTAQLNLLLGLNDLPLLDIPINQQQLNILHNKFVENSNTYKDSLKINLLIHAIESKNSLLSEYDSTVSFYKDPDIQLPIKEEYKLWLINDNKWGHLLLGFGTLGKSWNEIVDTDDTLDDLSIQSTLSSETVMVFAAEYPYLKTPEKQLYNWARKSSHNVPLDNLNQLSLGLYLLGEVIITDVFLNFHSTISDWYVPNHNCKLRWNQEVLGYTPQIKKIKFFNSNMYFDTLINHTGLKKLYD
jgi:hypothetical protein